MDQPIGRRKRVGYYVQYLALRLVLGLARLLPVDAASALGGRLGRAIGPHLRRHEVARRNMQCALPALSPAEIDARLDEMWDNLGRTFLEYAHLDTFGAAIDRGDGRVEVQGREHVDAAVAAGRGLIIFSGHFANWEVPVMLLSSVSRDSVAVYRQQNNPWIDRLLTQLRPSRTGKFAPKGAAGARDLIGALRAGGVVGVLVDQKYNEGAAVPFFGRDAMTVTGPAELAMRRGVPFIPVGVERRGGARFRITVEPPLALPPPDGGQDGLMALLGRMNATLEAWIRAAPGQWYWIHQRWPHE